ncbi:MAG TPA: CHASE4 domain-containing protein [Methanospirillum sp.]|nr:CHASE4 domain-containing protein [Methanospirillum sp.]
MRLYAQTLLIFGISLLIVTAVLLITFQVTVMDRFSTLEEASTQEDLKRAENAFGSECYRLHQIARDYAAWDDTYSFLQDRSTDYLTSNLNPTLLSGFNLTAFLIFDQNGILIAGSYLLATQDNPGSALSDLVDSVHTAGLSTPHPGGQAGLISGNPSPLIAASYPILSTRLQGPARGSIVVIDELDSTKIAAISESLVQDITISPAQGLREPTASSDSCTIPDISGKPLLVIELNKTHDLWQNGLQSGFFLVFLLLVFTVLFMVISVIALYLVIISPIRSLNRDLLTIGVSGSLSGRLTMQRSDEIGELATSINTMLSSLEVAQQERLTSEQRVSRLIELVQEGICLVGPDGLIWFANPMMGTIFESTSHALTGTRIGSLLVDEQEDESTVSEGERSDPEIQTRDRSGFLFGDSFGKQEYHTRTAGGREIWVTVSSAPYPLETGRMGFVCVVTDLTPFRSTERELLLSNKKLSLLGSMTRHDIVNQLTTIRGMLGLIKRKNAEPSLEQLISGAEDAAEKINKHIEFSKEYQKAGLEQPRWQDLRTIWTLAYAMTRKKGLTFTVTGDNYEIYADQLLQKVFYNLIDNTMRHGKDVFYISVSITSNDNSLLILYEDDGGGIPDTMKSKVFERGIGTGTGWGLFFIREVLGLTGIVVTEKGTFGIGVQFVITVPEGAFRPVVVKNSAE